MSAQDSSLNFVPLLKALEKLEYQLGSETSTHILVATPTLEEFKKQQLAPHNEVIQRKLLGPRVPVRRRRHTNQARLVLAQWPNDNLLEAALPSIFFILKGQADIRIADYAVHCWPGDLIFVPAGIPKMDGLRPYYEHITPDAYCSLLYITPGLAHREGLECNLSYSIGEKRRASNIDEGCWVRNLLVAQLFTGLEEELQNTRSIKIARHLFDLILQLLQREIREGRALKGWHFPSTSHHFSQRPLIQQAIEYIHNHLEKPLSIDSVARQIGVSRTAFTRDFRRETEKSFKSYLTEKRLEYAETLLKETNLPVNRVSKHVGLSYGQLRSHFHRKHRCTPGEFRDS